MLGEAVGLFFTYFWLVILRPQCWCCTSQIFVFEWSYLSLLHAFFRSSLRQYQRKPLSKTRFFGIHFFRTQYEYLQPLWRNWTQCYTEFGKITRNNGRYAAQGHSKSPLSVPIESPVYNFTSCANSSNFHPVSHRFQDKADYWEFIGQMFGVNIGCLCLTRAYGSSPIQDCEISKHGVKSISMCWTV